MTDQDMERLLSVCLQLTAQKDREALLSTILDTGMDLSNCDAGTLYLLEDDGLHFCRMVTRSLGIRQGGHADPINLPPVPLEEIEHKLELLRQAVATGNDEDAFKMLHRVVPTYRLPEEVNNTAEDLKEMAEVSI